MVKFTVTQIMKWYPCYDIDKVKELIGDGKTASEIAALDIPYRDIQWCLIRILYDIYGDKAVVHYAKACSERASKYANMALATTKSHAGASSRSSLLCANYADSCYRDEKTARDLLYYASMAASHSAQAVAWCLCAVFRGYDAALLAEMRRQIDYLVREIEG